MEVPNNWKVVPLDDLGADQYYAIGDGDHGQIKPSDYRDQGIPYIRVGDLGWGTFSTDKIVYISKEVHEKNLKSELLPGDILIAKTGATIGKCCIVPDYIERANTTSSVGKVTINRDLTSSKWILYYFLSPEFFKLMWSHSHRTAQPGFNNKDLKKFPVPLPPLPEQERIVSKLDSIFAHLEIAKQGLEKIPVLLKEFRQAVLTQAITGKLTEEWREGKELEGVDCLLLEENRILEIENENFQLEKLGKRKQKETPFTVFGKNELGWLIVNVESACVFIVDCLHNTPQFESTGYSVIDTTCISPFKIDWDKARKVNSEYFEKWTERLTPNYRDILFSREGTIGIAVKVPEGAELCIGQRMMLFRMAKFVLPEYAEIYFNSFIFRDEYFPHIKGVAAQHLNIGSIRELPFPIPSFLEQTEIVRRVEALFSKSDAFEAQYKIVKEQIDQLPQAVLAKAFRGEV